MTRAVLFDLDGTLIDTAKDLGNALNHVLSLHGKPTVDYAISRPFVSGGSPALIKLGFNLTAQDPEFESIKQAFLEFYLHNLCQHSTPFAGIAQCLTMLDDLQIKWGIVTNKPEFLTTPLLDLLGLSSRSHVTISGDTFAYKKPDPFPLLKAAEQLGIAANNIAYFGDDQRDIVAAKAANMVSVSVGWGYPGESSPLSWEADYHLDNSEQLSSFIQRFVTNLA